MTLHRPITLRGFGDANSDLGDLALGDVPGTGSDGSGGSLLSQIVGGAKQYYEGLSAVQAAQLNQQLQLARGQAAVASAKAGGQYQATQAGGAGALPSPSLLLTGGLVLAAVFLLTKK